jgi:hypothetical protein
MELSIQIPLPIQHSAVYNDSLNHSLTGYWYRCLLLANMKTETIIGATATISAMQMTGIELTWTDMQTTTRDPWDCIPANLSQYIDVPKPTGALFSAFVEYGSRLQSACTHTGLETSLCARGKSDWCGLSTAAPPEVMGDLSSYGSAASSWWSAHSSAMTRDAERCPYTWKRTGTEGSKNWLNITNFLGECYVEAQATGSPASTKSVAASTGTTSTKNAVTGSGPTGGAPKQTEGAPKQTEKAKTNQAYLARRADVVEKLLVFATGLAAVMGW